MSVQQVRQYACAALVGFCALSLASCVKQKESETAAGVDTPTLNSRPDTELFGTNIDISDTLEQEIKRQFLQAMQNSGVLKTLAGENGKLWLVEIGIARTEKSLLDIDVGVNGGVVVRSRPFRPSETDNSSVPSPLSANVSTAYRLQTSKYNVSFAFQERITSATEGEISRFPLKKPLVIEENIRIASRVKLSFSAINALPPNVGTIIARFFDDINLSLDSGISFERNSDLSTRMYFRSGKGGMTELMHDMVADVGIPMCLKAVALSGKDKSTCSAELPPIENPVIALQRRISTPPLRITSCEKTTIREGLLPIYKLNFAISPQLQIFQPNSKAYLYYQDGVSWRKFDWVTVLGVNTKSTCKLPTDSTKKCITVKYGKNFFDASCDQINSGALRVTIKDEDTPIIY